jgi:hypothetical protein
LPLVVDTKSMSVWVHKGAPPELTSEIRQPGYAAPGLGPADTEVLPPTEGEPAPIKPDGEYYMRLGIHFADGLDFPVSMARLFDAFYRLDDVGQRRFLKACFWYREASRRGSYSATYLAMITAIEAMQSNQVGAVENCECCGKALINGPTELFVEFLERYAPGGTNKLRKDLYRHRSKLTHGEVLMADRTFIWGLSPQQWQDGDREERARRTVQIALIGWLLETAGDDPLDLAFDAAWTTG